MAMMAQLARIGLLLSKRQNWIIYLAMALNLLTIFVSDIFSHAPSSTVFSHYADPTTKSASFFVSHLATVGALLGSIVAYVNAAAISFIATAFAKHYVAGNGMSFDKWNKLNSLGKNMCLVSSYLITDSPKANNSIPFAKSWLCILGVVLKACLGLLPAVRPHSLVSPVQILIRSSS